MKRLLSVALMVLLNLVGVVGVSSAEDKAIQTIITELQNKQYAVRALPATVNPGVPVKPKMYYLTKDSLDGGDAIKACNSGFHMASISEIQDPSNLQYANRSTTVYDSLVDGPSSGPPSNHVGWVRSGVYPPSGFVYDCNDFSNEHDIQLGTTAALHSLSVNAGPGQSASHPTTWWHAALHPCTQPKPVWCVEDPE